MLIVKENQSVNLDNVISFLKRDTEIKNDGMFKKDPNLPSIEYSLEFYLPAGVIKMAEFIYETKEKRDEDFRIIIEAYNLNFRICDL